MSIPQTPSKVGVLQSITFPIHQMKPCLLDWWKLVFLTKFYSVIVKLSFDIEKQTEWEPYIHLKTLGFYGAIDPEVLWSEYGKYTISQQSYKEFEIKGIKYFINENDIDNLPSWSKH